MADAFTGTSAVTWDQPAYDLATRFALRPQLFFDGIADVQASNQSKPGSAVIFDFTNDLSEATSTLSETVDVDAVAVSNSQVTLTLAEKGNVVKTTALLRGTSHIPVDPVVANLVGFNAGISLDTIARNAVQAGSNVRYGTGASSRVTVATTSLLTAANVRRTYAEMLGANVAPINGYYAALIHPDVSYDLRGETGAAAWRDPHTYSQPAEIWSGELGEFEGFRFMVSPRAPLFVDAGVGGTVDVYGTLFWGREAIGKAFSTTDGNGPDPRVVPGPVTDALRRFVPMGWYHLIAYGRIREAALRRYETSSSIGAN